MRLSEEKIWTLLLIHCTHQHPVFLLLIFWTIDFKLLLELCLLDMAPAPYCQKYACMIQDCLDRHRQDQSKLGIDFLNLFPSLKKMFQYFPA